MLAKISPSRIIDTASIRSIEAGHQKTVVRLTGGETILSDMDMEDAEKLTGTIVPAQPGFVLIQARPPMVKEGETEPVFINRPVLAFRVTAEMSWPITMDGEPAGTWAVVCPDGRCDQAFEGLHASASDFRNAYTAQIRAQMLEAA